MPRPPLPAQTLRLRLPAMTAEQAAQMLDLVDELQRELWTVYADAVLDLAAERDTHEPPPDHDPPPPF